MSVWRRTFMCRIQKKRVLLKWFCGLTAVGLLIGICLALKDNQKKAGYAESGNIRIWRFRFQNGRN